MRKRTNRINTTKEQKEYLRVRVIAIVSIILIISGILINILSKKDTIKPPYEITTITYTSTVENTVYSKSTSKNKTTKKRTTKKTTKKATNGKYKLTHYGSNCKGCSGITASGYNVKNTMFYNDSQFGKVRIVATSNQFKMYSIIRIKDYKLGDITCIVLDRGVGNGVIDLLVSSEKVATQLGIQKVNIEVLRYGK